MSDTESEFIVKLEGIKLPADVEARISKEIQVIVMREVAAIDLEGDLQAHFPKKEWRGIWLKLNKVGNISVPRIVSDDIKR